jgi:DNA-binding response OmpR family regulator
MSKKILIAEDQPDSRHLLEDLMTLFQPFGVQVLTAVDGIQAYDIAAKERPNLLLLDIMMPGMSGLEVCQKLKSDPQTAGIYIVMVSAKNSLEDRQHAASLGANEYITKPFEVMHMLERVRYALGVNPVWPCDRSPHLLRAYRPRRHRLQHYRDPRPA